MIQINRISQHCQTIHDVSLQLQEFCQLYLITLQFILCHLDITKYIYLNITLFCIIYDGYLSLYYVLYMAMYRIYVKNGYFSNVDVMIKYCLKSI